MNGQLLERFVRLLMQQTGIATRDADRGLLAEKLAARARTLSLDMEGYYALLQPAPNGALSAKTAREWQALIPALVTGESYLFRDRGQFSLLERELLPTAIAARRRLHAANGGSDRPTLKIWSAGCSTGEEIYSIAISLSRLLPDWEQWNLQLVGTDINPDSVAAARLATYSNWSFRQVQPEIRERYFQPVAKKRWQLLPPWRQLVRFERGNLLADNFAAPIFQDCDLIVCRNVFIYFESAAIARVLEKFTARLRPGGYLLCGHTELHDCDTSPLATRVFPESIVYQRQASNGNSQVPSAAASKLAPTLASGSPPLAAIPPVAFSLEKPAVPDKERPLPVEGAPATPVATFSILLATARARAESNQLDLAARAASEAHQLDPDAIAPLQLLARIAADRGDTAAAKRYWRQILYLDPRAIVAYLELAAILQGEGNTAAADNQQDAARGLLAKLPPTQAIDCGPGYPEQTAAQLLRQLQP